MYSQLTPSFLYTDLSPEVLPHDNDVVSDVWMIDGRSVYRGRRDTTYTHANVYWLYDEDMNRVGCTEHDIVNRSNFRALWIYESPFATLLQEEGWRIEGSLFRQLPPHVADLFINEGWVTPSSVLEKCLYGPSRVISHTMLQTLPLSYFTCPQCDIRTLTKHSCSTQEVVLDFPIKEKIWFVDEDLFVHFPPPTSRIYDILFMKQPLVCGLSLPEQEEVLEHSQHTPLSLPPQDPRHSPPLPPSSPDLQTLPPPPQEMRPEHCHEKEEIPLRN